MKEIRIKLPPEYNCETNNNIITEIKNGELILKDTEVKFGDYVKFKDAGLIGIVTKTNNVCATILSIDNHYYTDEISHIVLANENELIKIAQFLLEHNLVVDYTKNEITYVYTRWRAPKGDYYYFIDMDNIDLVLMCDHDYTLDKQRYRSGNYFKYEEEAKVVLSEIKQILEKHK